MSKSTMKPVAIGLIAIGAGLAFWGYQKADGFESRVINVLTGSPGDDVMMFYIACAAVGIFLFGILYNLWTLNRQVDEANRA